MSTEEPKKRRGFACLSPEKRKEIATKGGKAVSANKEYMASIGKKGGDASGVARKKSDQS